MLLFFEGDGRSARVDVEREMKKKKCEPSLPNAPSPRTLFIPSFLCCSRPHAFVLEGAGGTGRVEQEREAKKNKYCELSRLIACSFIRLGLSTYTFIFFFFLRKRQHKGRTKRVEGKKEYGENAATTVKSEVKGLKNESRGNESIQRKRSNKSDSSNDRSEIRKKMKKNSASSLFQESNRFLSARSSKIE